jgi:hypothetical protein
MSKLQSIALVFAVLYVGAGLDDLQDSFILAIIALLSVSIDFWYSVFKVIERRNLHD